MKPLIGTVRPTTSNPVDHMYGPGRSGVVKSEPGLLSNPSAVHRSYSLGQRSTGQGHFPTRGHIQSSPQPRSVTKPQRPSQSPQGTLGPYFCEKCQKSFTTKGGLGFHMQQHTGKFSFWCDECQRGFAVRCNYQAHMAKHEGRTFPCDLCLKRFSCKRSLQRHYVEHKQAMDSAMTNMSQL